MISYSITHKVRTSTAIAALLLISGAGARLISQTDAIQPSASQLAPIAPTLSLGEPIRSTKLESDDPDINYQNGFFFNAGVLGHILIRDKDGHLTGDFNLQPQETSSVLRSMDAVAIFRDGSIVASWYYMLPHDNRHYIKLVHYNPAGNFLEDIDLGQWRPARICIADDKSIWSLSDEEKFGMVAYSPGVGVLRNYKFGSGLVRAVVPLSNFPQDDNNSYTFVKSAIDCSGNKIHALTGDGQWIEYTPGKDFTITRIDEVSRTDFGLNWNLSGFAYLDNGHAYATIHSGPGDPFRRMLAELLPSKDGKTLQWVDGPSREDSPCQQSGARRRNPTRNRTQKADRGHSRAWGRPRRRRATRLSHLSRRSAPMVEAALRQYQHSIDLDDGTHNTGFRHRWTEVSYMASPKEKAMRFRKTTRAALYLTALLAFSTAHVPAQSKDQSSVPTLKVTSRETVVDVTVTDAKGNPVHGLKQSDFTVKEDGKVQSIRSFEEFDSNTPTATQAPPKLPPNTYTNQQPPPASSAINILLLDFVNTAAVPSVDLEGGGDALGRAMASQVAAKREAMKYVANMPSGTRVIVLGLSKSLRTLQGLTSDPALLSAAIDSMEISPEGNATPRPEFSFFTQRDQRTRMTRTAMNQIAADLSGIKGKKNLLWFTVGMPWLNTFSLRMTYGLLAQAQIAVYPIDVRGVITVPDAFFTWHGRSWQNVNEIPPEPHNRAVQEYQMSTAEEQLAMGEWAEATGGEAYYNSNDLASLIAKAVDKGANYYTLSYIPPGTEYDGRHHTIKLEADKPDLHLTYRDEYYAEDLSKIKRPAGLTLATTAPDAVNGDMKTVMSRSMPTSTQLLFNVRVEPSTAPAKPGDPPILGTLDPTVKMKLKGKPLTRYAFSYSISAGQLAYTSGPNATHNGSVELDIAAYDADTKLVTGLSQTVTMTLNDTTVANKQPLNFSQQLDLPPGQFFLRIGVLDRTSNKVGTLEISLTVGKGSSVQKP